MGAVLERPTVERVAVSVRASKSASAIDANPPKPAPAQINVRLDRELKEAGDRELERMGITPSQVVRSLWEKLAGGGADAEAVRKLLIVQDEPEQEMSAAQKRKLEVMEEIKQSWQDLADTLGLDLSTFKPSEDEDRHDAYCEYQLEKWGEY